MKSHCLRSLSLSTSCANITLRVNIGAKRDLRVLGVLGPDKNGTWRWRGDHKCVKREWEGGEVYEKLLTGLLIKQSTLFHIALKALFACIYAYVYDLLCL
jgi:hypothetical protein